MRTYLIFSLLLFVVISFGQDDQNIITEAKKMIDQGLLNEPITLLEEELKSNQTIKDELLIADIHYYLGLCYYNQGQYDLSIQNYQASIDLFKKNKLNHRVADVYSGLGNTIWWKTNDNQAALEYQELAIATFNKAPKSDHERQGVYYQELGHILIWMGEYKQAEEAILKSISVNEKILGRRHRSTALSFFTLGKLMKVKGDNFKASEAIEQAILIYEEIENLKKHPDLAAFYGELGDVLTRIGDYPKALSYFKKATVFTSPNTRNGLLLKMAIADCQKEMGQIQDGIKSYEEIMNILDTGMGQDVKSGALFGFGLCKIQSGEYKEGIELFDKAEKAIKARYGNGHIHLGEFYEGAAGALASNKQYERVNDYLNKAIVIYKDSLPEPNLHGMASCYNTMGTLWGAKLNADSAIYFYEESLNIIIPKNTIVEKIPHPKLFMFTLWNRSEAYKDKYDKTGKVEHLELAIQGFQKLSDHLDFYREQNYSEASLAFLNNENHILYQRLVSLYYLLSKEKKDEEKKILAKMFEASEKSNAYLLLRAMSDANILKGSNYRDSLDQINKGIAYYEKEIYQEKNLQKIKEFEGNLFDLRSQIYSLNKRIKKDFPLFQKIYSQGDLASIEKIQQEIISTEQTFLKYFISSNNEMFAFVINQEEFGVFKIKKDFPLDSLVQNLQQGIYGAYSEKEFSNKKFEETLLQYTETAPKLYGKLIAPVQHLLTEEVIVIPDGVLGYVPFEALLKSYPKRLDKFDSYPFLVKDHRFSYCYSATLLKEMKEKQHRQAPTKSLVAFAPFYNGSYEKLNALYDPALDTLALSLNLPNLEEVLTRKKFNQLPSSGEEAKIASKLWDGDYYIDQEATEEKFNEEAGDYRIVHLSTHGVADSRVGDYSYLAFSEQKDSIENEYLYVRDLYNTELNADLVVLSACETGTGELQRGEGIISLARAFAYAGAKSILTTLWVVDDTSTKELTKVFYIQLRKGDPKDLALQKAKLQILKGKDNRRKHPFFWAAMIGVGDMSAVK